MNAVVPCAGEPCAYERFRASCAPSQLRDRKTPTGSILGYVRTRLPHLTESHSGIPHRMEPVGVGGKTSRPAIGGSIAGEARGCPLSISCRGVASALSAHCRKAQEDQDDHLLEPAPPGFLSCPHYSHFNTASDAVVNLSTSTFYHVSPTRKERFWQMMASFKTGNPGPNGLTLPVMPVQRCNSFMFRYVW